MKKLKYTLIIILSACIILALSTACEFSVVQTEPAVVSPITTTPDIEESTVEITSPETPLLQSPAIPMVLMPVASGTLVADNEKASIDYSNITDGYVMINWLKDTDKQLRVLITGPGDITYTYRLTPDTKYVVFPLSEGDGSYEVKALEQTTDGRYAVAVTATFNVSLKDEFMPFLHPNQFVDFNESSDVVLFAASIVTGKEALVDKINAVYDFVSGNISYDTEFAEAIINGSVDSHLPDLDRVIASGKGICFDYAAVMAAMLRSQGIPTKMVFGYVGDVYHAWINVYSEETGWIDNLIFFDGVSWIIMDPTFASSASNPAALAEFIGTGTNYAAKYLY